MSVDGITSFMTKGHEANGKIIKLDESINEILHKHNYPKSVSRLLSELLVINVYLGHGLKSDGIVTCQMQSDNSILHLLVSEYVYGGKIRGYASIKDEFPANEDYDFERLVGNGHLIVTYESAGERYQGVIELKNGSISNSFKEYLEQSEQIDSELKIFSKIENDKFHAAGMIIKKLPKKESDENKDFDENWEKFSVFVQSLKEDEMFNLSEEDILRRLFHEDGVIMYDKDKIDFSCRCSREKMEKIINNIDEKEKEDLKVDGKIAIKCQFCGNEEFFD